MSCSYHRENISPEGKENAVSHDYPQQPDWEQVDIPVPGIRGGGLEAPAAEQPGLSAAVATRQQHMHRRGPVALGGACSKPADAGQP